ncbi:hypothetical protein DP176_04520 [Polynucleobacter paneuropaeus]|uniref:Glycosyltransferase RgtA/B/C/D-like domain-containing protein n=1 Tax=Polynucleobacter paneuropaeus TaxID=2527775 RepID=A0ABX9FBR4_9BURK|nr:hypothetical protein [Polynucleobacter paneuropaeus]QWD18439.1 hypothetical protein G6696_02165 [Polynucleobacter paneuropaeus]RAZ41857.1 hypothetical protein DP176_04520 [Polynucleobacter paneuropaeus]
MQSAIGNYLKRIPFAIWILVLIFLPVIYVIIWVAPPNMDEFLPYHRIACTEYPAAVEHIFTESCFAHPVKFFQLSYFSSYSYVGNSSNYLYKPFFSIFSAPLSHYILGLLVMIVFSVALTKVMETKILIALVPLLYFPLVFQTIHDTGPIKISLLAYPLIMYSTIKLLKPSTSIAKKLLALLILFLAVAISMESKPFFLYLLPQVLLLGFGYAYATLNQNQININGLGKFISQIRNGKFLLWLSLISFSVLLALFLVLFCIKYGNSSYFSFLTAQVNGSSSVISQLKMIRDYLIFPFMFTSRIYDVSRYQQIISAIFFLPVLFILYSYLKKKTLVGYILLTSILVLIVIFTIARNTWSGHHFIFLHLPIILMLMIFANQSLEKFKKVIIILSTLMVVCGVLLVFGQVGTHSSAERSTLFKSLSNSKLASNSVINFSSWGGYYIQSLYGDQSQLVTYIEPMTGDEATRLAGIAKRLNRPFIINVCHSCSKEDMMKFFPGKQIDRESPNNSNWVIWRISQLPKS